MRKLPTGEIVFFPSDLITFLASPFASWMDRHHLEHPGALLPDAVTDDQRLVIDTGLAHERAVLAEFRDEGADLVEIPAGRLEAALLETRAAIAAGRGLIYQAALQGDRFAGFVDFLEKGVGGDYQAWDAKLARSPKPYYIVQLCCYSEMLAELTGKLPERFGVVLGSKLRTEFRLEEFIHYYHGVKADFLTLQDAYGGKLEDRPEPSPRADHGRWTSYAERYFDETDHLVRVAGISSGQIKKLRAAGISTLADLAKVDGQRVPKLSGDSLAKLSHQARLQLETRTARAADPSAPPQFEVIASAGGEGEGNRGNRGLAALPVAHEADVFFDMEGYPLHPGGLEYLFGVLARDAAGRFEFRDWWAHDRTQERAAFEGFMDWVYARWRANPGLHIYHYAAYEESAIKRLSTFHDSRQVEVDQLLRNEVFVDLYQVVKQGLVIGEDSYSIKRVERLYWRGRDTDVATAVDSIVQYANWIASGEPASASISPILGAIRDYNEDDVRSTAALVEWLRKVAADHGIVPVAPPPPVEDGEDQPKDNPIVLERLAAVEALRLSAGDETRTLADLVDFHRREDKPKWWRFFERARIDDEQLRDDPGCIEGVWRVGEPVAEKRSLVQSYAFDPNQECRLAAGPHALVCFTHALGSRLNLHSLDLGAGRLSLKSTAANLAKGLGDFPKAGSLVEYEVVRAEPIQDALLDLAKRELGGTGVPASVSAILSRRPPPVEIRRDGESDVAAARRVTEVMAAATASPSNGSCLVVQGPPGTGKTYTASRAIAGLLAQGKRVGVTSNSHKAIANLLAAAGAAVRAAGGELAGLRVASGEESDLHRDNPRLRQVGPNSAGFVNYQGGIVGGTAWLFSLPAWDGQLDFLFIDEAGQVSLANAVAMARCARHIVLLGDQMQLEQPVQGTHPGDAGMSVLQYALKDRTASLPDAPVFHAVVPPEDGLFLGVSRRMHPEVCHFISQNIYQGRLAAHPDCARQAVSVPNDAKLVTRPSGIVFSPVEHDGNTQRSAEEVKRVVALCHELLGRDYTNKDGVTAPLGLADFLFIAPYNAQVRALKDALPAGAQVGSVDKFQGQEAPVCILSLCSSFGEYGSRGLGFILDRNRVNVAISRAKCLAVVVADPRIAATQANSIEEMRLLNLFCHVAGR